MYKMLVHFLLEQHQEATQLSAATARARLTVGVQTDYRESETQTEPFSPEYVIHPEVGQPELLQLAYLTWGQGLPAGVAEVELIERARARRAWEATLPSLDDLSQLNKRREMMEEMEVKEWNFLAEEIQKLQDTRLALLRDLLKQRDEAENDLAEEKLHHIHFKLQSIKEIKLRKIHKNYVDKLRKLEAKRSAMEGKPDQRGPDFTDESTHITPINKASFTRSIDDLRSYCRETYKGLSELEAAIANLVPKPRERKPQGKVDKKSLVTKPPAERLVTLMNRYKALREEHKLKKMAPTSHVPRPVTPTVKEPPEREEKMELAVIQVQKLLRGRKVQKEMFRGRENCADVIKELRDAHSLQQQQQGAESSSHSSTPE